MNRLSIRLGYWSAVLSIIGIIGYMIGLALAIIVFPLPPWTNLADYVAALKPASMFAFTLCQITAFLAGPLFLILFCSLHEFAPDNKKILTKIGLCCMIATMVLGCQMYFVHFNAVRLILSKANLAGLEQFVEWNTNSAIMASGVLAWTFFVGLAFLFTAPIFSGGRLNQWLKYAFFVYGGLSVLGMVGHLFGIMIFTLLYFLDQTLVALIVFIFLSIFFKRLKKEAIIKVQLPK